MHFFPKELGNWRQALQREFLLSAEVLPEGQDRSRQLKNLAIFKNKYVFLSYIYRQTTVVLSCGSERKKVVPGI